MTRSRNRRGQSIVELVAGVILIVPVVLLLIDLAALVLGVTSNDNLCREAARVASAGDPDQANQRAQQVVAQANATKGGIIAQYVLDRAQANVIGTRPDGTTGGVVQGNVEVETTVVVAPPFLLNAVNNRQAFQFKTHQAFPITFYVKQTVQPN